MEITLGPRETLLALCFVAAAVALGFTSGLVPELHANTVMLLLVGIAPSVSGPPLYVGMAMLAAGVTHTFLEIVPTLALGVPDPAMAVAPLPGHRFAIEGRGGEALRLSVLESTMADLLKAPLVGWVPARLGARRTNLMGELIGPIVLG